LEFPSSVKTNGITVMETDFPATTFLAQRETVGFENISAFFQKYLPEIYGFASTTTNKPIGMPYGLFYVYDEPAQKTDMAAAVSIPSNSVFDKNPYQVIQIPASKCVVANFYGSYEQTGKAHEALDKYMNERNLTFVAPAMEQYISDPTEAKDASEILTKVIYLYK
jgi:effector-binding domain-containing protein